MRLGRGFRKFKLKFRSSLAPTPGLVPGLRHSMGSIKLLAAAVKSLVTSGYLHVPHEKLLSELLYADPPNAGESR